MKRVGILGGTFNPPHIGHCMMANEVLNALNLDEVRLMPNAIAPHKEVRLSASDEQRLEMVRLAIEDEPLLKVESFEIERGGISYTHDTMQAMREREQDVEFYFIIGGDSIESLHTWYKIDELRQLVHFVGVNRPGFAATMDAGVQVIEAPEIDLSSSLLRHRLEEGKTVRFLTPEKVETFIRKEGLYGTR